MKIETVVKINLQGDYEVLYLGSNRGEARQIYKDNMNKKEEFMALFQQSGYASRTMSKIGHQTHAFNKESKEIVKAPVKKTRRKKVSEE